MGRFFRLVVAERHPFSGQLAGVFAAASRLERDGTLPAHERTAIADLFRWFNRNLPVPRSMKDAAICWFKGAANPCTRRIWDLS
jgi:hypothetical protein